MEIALRNRHLLSSRKLSLLYWTFFYINVWHICKYRAQTDAIWQTRWIQNTVRVYSNSTRGNIMGWEDVCVTRCVIAVMLGLFTAQLKGESCSYVGVLSARASVTRSIRMIDFSSCPCMRSMYCVCCSLYLFYMLYSTVSVACIQYPLSIWSVIKYLI